MTDTTVDRPAAGVVVHQPRRGFRYSLDPLCLAGWILEDGVPESVLDVGTGSGILALLLARAGVATVTGVDVRPEWAPLQAASARDSGLDVRFETADIRSWAGPAADLAVANPPFFRAGEGRRSPDPLRAHARHELAGSLAEIVAGAARHAPQVALVLPAPRADEAVAALLAHERPVRRRCDLGDRLVLLLGDVRPLPLVHEREALFDVQSGFGPRVQSWYARLGAPLAKGPDANT
jgi:tRNA1Val (adenine37-N6)-methyltransferase